MGHLSGGYELDFANQFIQYAFVGRHLVVRSLDDYDPKGEPFQIVLKLEAPVDGQEDVETSPDNPQAPREAAV